MIPLNQGGEVGLRVGSRNTADFGGLRVGSRKNCYKIPDF